MGLLCCYGNQTDNQFVCVCILMSLISCHRVFVYNYDHGQHHAYMLVINRHCTINHFMKANSSFLVNVQHVSLQIHVMVPWDSVHNHWDASPPVLAHRLCAFSQLTMASHLFNGILPSLHHDDDGLSLFRAILPVMVDQKMYKFSDGFG